jgi:hypothetical protein
VRLTQVVLKITMQEFLALRDAIVYRIDIGFDILEDFVLNGIRQEDYEWFRDELRNMTNARQLMNIVVEQIQEYLETQLKVVGIEEKKVNSNNE